MGAMSLNHEGEQSQLNVTGVAVGLTLPDYLDPATNKRVMRTPSHALIYTNKTVRWRADGQDPNPDFGMVLLANEKLSFMDWGTDCSGIISRIKFCTDAATVGSATLEVALFT